MTNGFRVSINNGLIHILMEDEVPETDIIDLLQFDETQLEDLYRNHAAIQARWEQIAINRKNKYEHFKEDFEKKWWAHNKKFAKMLCFSYGEKTPTMDSIKDNVINIYSSETSDFLREKYADLVYDQASKKKLVYHNSKDDFISDMYKYINMEPAWFYENLTKTVSKLKEEVETLQNIAKRLEARSYHMKDLKDLVMEKHGNTGPMHSYDKEIRNNQQMQGYEDLVNKK